MSGPAPDPEQPQHPGPPPSFQPSWGQPGPGQPPYGAQPGYPAPPAQPGYQQPGYPQPGYAPPPGWGYAPVAPDHPRATTALVLGLVGLIGGLACGLPLLASPFAWWIGVKTRREIDAQPGVGGRGQATAGMVTGIIGTVLLALSLALLVLIVVLALTGSFDDSGSVTYDTNAAARLW